MLEGFIPSVKRLLLLCAVGCIFFVGAHTAFAQAFPPGSPADPFNPPPQQGPGGAEGFEDRVGGGTPSNPSPIGGGRGTINPSPGGVTDPNFVPTPPPEEPPVEVSSSGCWSKPEGFLNCIVVSFFGSIVAIAGYTFDASIRMFIVGFGDLYLQYGIGSTVERVWTTVRDVFNLTFIFGLVYIGFQIILGTNESSAKRTLPLLILAALLVNFSLFVVKFIVDFANLAAIQIFNLFTAGASPTAQVGDQGIPADGIVDVLANARGDSLSLAFINTIGMSGLLNNSVALDGTGGGIMYMFTMVIIFCVLTYVFFAGAILITIRFAALVFYMIFSPIMFLGWVFPGFKSYTDKFWKGLFGQAFFAPTLLFMLYVTYQLARGFNDGSRMGGEGISANPENITAFAQFIPYLVMIVIFIVASYVVARKMADTGGSMVMKANDWGIGKLNGALRGGGGMLAGGAGQFGYKRIDKLANSDNAIARGIGRTLTYSGVRDKAEKAYKGSIQGQWKETRKKRTGEMANRGADARFVSNVSAGLTAQPGSQAQIDFERSIQNANQSQLIDSLKEHTPGTDGYNRIVRAMSHAQVKGLLEAKNDVFNAGSQASLRAAYTTQTAERMTVGTGNNGTNRSLPDAISRGSAEDLAALGLPNLTPHASNISAARMDDLRSKLTPTEHQNLNRSRTTQLQAMMTNPVSRAQVFTGKSDKEIARLPREVLLATDSAGRPLAVEYLNRNILDIMMQGNSNDSYVNSGDRQALRNLITSGRVLNPNVSDMANWLTSSPRGLGF